MKKYLQILFWVTIIVLKVSSVTLHISLNHGDDDTHKDKCEFCEYAIHNQDIDSDVAIQSYNIELFLFNFSEQKNFYKSIFRKLSVDNTRFSRPPPSLV